MRFINKTVATLSLTLFWGSTLTAFATVYPKIITWKEQGVPVYYVQRKNLPFVDLMVTVNAGASYDGAQWGLAELTASMLDEGAGGVPAGEVASRFDTVGAVYKTDVQQDDATFFLRTLTDPEFLQAAVTNFSMVLSKPTFATADFQRVQNQALVGLQLEAQQPDQIAQKKLFAVAYQQGPYTHLPSGSVATVSKLTASDLQNFYNRFYNRNNAKLIIVGDVDHAAAAQIAHSVVADLKPGVPAPALTVAPALQKTQMDKTAFPSQQTTLLMGQPAVFPNQPDRFSLLVANWVLGGGFNSELFTAIREKRALAYGATSLFYGLRYKGPFMLQLQTRNALAQQSLDVSLQTLKQFLLQGPTAAQTKTAQDNLRGQFLQNISSNLGVASTVKYMALYDLPLNSLETYAANIDAVTPSGAKQAFARAVNPNALAVVAVGADAASLTINTSQ